VFIYLFFSGGALFPCLANQASGIAFAIPTKQTVNHQQGKKYNAKN